MEILKLNRNSAGEKKFLREFNFHNFTHFRSSKKSTSSLKNANKLRNMITEIEKRQSSKKRAIERTVNVIMIDRYRRPTKGWRQKKLPKITDKGHHVIGRNIQINMIKHLEILFSYFMLQL